MFRIFWEVNTGRACDFLPWLLAAPWRHKSDVRQWTSDIRQYVLDTFVRDFDPDKEDRGLLRSLMQKVELDRDSKVGVILFVISAEKYLMFLCAGPGQPDDLRARAVRYRGYPGRALRRGQLRGAGADRRGHAASRPGRGAGRAGGRAGGGRPVRPGGQVKALLSTGTEYCTDVLSKNSKYSKSSLQVANSR